MYCVQCGNIMVDNENVCSHCKYDTSNDIHKNLEFIYIECEKVLQDALNIISNTCTNSEIINSISEILKPYLKNEYKVIGQETIVQIEFSMEAAKRAGFVYQKGIGYTKGYLIIPDRPDWMVSIFNCGKKVYYNRDVYGYVKVICKDSLKSQEKLVEFLFTVYPKLKYLMQEYEQRLKEINNNETVLERIKVEE